MIGEEPANLSAVAIADAGMFDSETGNLDFFDQICDAIAPN